MEKLNIKNFEEEKEQKEKVVLVGEKIEKENIFETFITKEIISAFSEDLVDAGFEDDEVLEFKNQIYTLDEGLIKGVLSMPKELRIRIFQNIFR